MTEPTPAIQMDSIVVRFPGVLANDHVDFSLKNGEIHALLGENGAGKSTLMNVLTGLYRPVSGTIKVHGEVVSFGSPRDAIAKGIGMVHQHFMLVPTQTVTENILLGLQEPRFILNLSVYDKKIQALQEKFGLHVDPTAKVWQLSVGEQQRVEILKTLYRGANILIFDEPTAVLAPQEIEEFMGTLRTMVAAGKSIVFISHKLHEVMEIANRLTVLRKGKTTANGISAEGVSREELAELMVGRKVVFTVKKTPSAPGEIVLAVKNVSAENNKGIAALKNLSLEVRSGEILGIAGVAGNGQSELAEVITGLRPCKGVVEMNGQVISNQPPWRAIRAGISHVPEDRTGVGSAPNMTITENTIMKNYRQDPIGHGWSINLVNARAYAGDLKKKYDILAPSVATLARKLSGGNLQKVILAREISSGPRMIVAVQPTRGLDVGAIESVQSLLLDQRDLGCGILLVSEELEELFALSDRIAVIYEGQLMGVVNTEDADINRIGMMMTGSKETEL